MSGVATTDDAARLAHWIQCSACSRHCLSAFAEAGTISPCGAIGSPKLAAAIYGEGVVQNLVKAHTSSGKELGRVYVAREKFLVKHPGQLDPMDRFLDDENEDEEEDEPVGRGQRKKPAGSIPAVGQESKRRGNL